MTGPLSSAREARSAPEVKAIYAAAASTLQRGILTEGCRQLLREALAYGGVPVGKGDEEYIEHFAQALDVDQCYVIAHWIRETRDAAERRASGEGS
jgi:hypothetical protein